MNMSQIWSCSIDPATNSKNTNHEYFFTKFVVSFDLVKEILDQKEESPLMTSDIRVGRGVQDSPQNRTL